MYIKKCLHEARGQKRLCYRCDVEKCEDTSAAMVEKGKIWKEGRT